MWRQQNPPPCPSISPTLNLQPLQTACRAMAYQEGERAKKLENPTIRGPLETNSKPFAALAEKFEAARKRQTVIARSILQSK